MNTHELMRNGKYRELREEDRRRLLEHGILNHFEKKNNVQVLDSGLGTFMRFDVQYVSFKEYFGRVSALLEQSSVVSGLKLKGANDTVMLSMPARNALKHVRRDLDRFCETYLTPIFDEIKKENKEKAAEAKAEKEATEAAVAAALAEKKAEKKAAAEKKEAEASKKAAMEAALREADEIDWE